MGNDKGEVRPSRTYEDVQKDIDAEEGKLEESGQNAHEIILS